MRWLDSLTDAMDMNLNKLWEIVEGRGTWHAAVHRVTKSQTWLSDWTTATLFVLLKHYSFPWETLIMIQYEPLLHYLRQRHFGFLTDLGATWGKCSCQDWYLDTIYSHPLSKFSFWKDRYYDSLLRLFLIKSPTK